MAESVYFKNVRRHGLPVKTRMDSYGDETSAPYALASWELPPCMGCGSIYLFHEGFCAHCWIAYTEEP